MFCRPDRHARHVLGCRCLRLTAVGRNNDLARLRIQFNHCVFHFQPFKFKSWTFVFTEVFHHAGAFSLTSPPRVISRVCAASMLRTGSPSSVVAPTSVNTQPPPFLFQ